MSGKLIGQVYERQLGHAEQSVMLAMADHADDFGANCYPSVPYVAWKTGYQERQVQRVIARLRDMGALILVREASRYRPTEYHVNLDALPMKPAFTRGDIYDARGDIPAASGVTFTTPGVTFGAARGDILSTRGDIAVSPEPPIEPKTEPEDIPTPVLAAPTSATPPKARKPRPPTPPRPRDAMFDAYCIAWGIDPDHPGRRASLAKEFSTRCKTAGATIDQFRDYYRTAKASGDWGKFDQPHNVADRFLATVVTSSAMDAAAPPRSRRRLDDALIAFGLPAHPHRIDARGWPAELAAEFPREAELLGWRPAVLA